MGAKVLLSSGPQMTGNVVVPAAVSGVLAVSSLGNEFPIKLILVVGEADGGAYGSKWKDGQSVGQSLLCAFLGTDAPLVLTARGYDIDDANEVSVSINGTIVGYLSITAEDTLSATLDTFPISAGQQVSGRNELVFYCKGPKRRWGVTDILLDYV